MKTEYPFLIIIDGYYLNSIKIIGRVRTLKLAKEVIDLARRETPSQDYKIVRVLE